MPGGASASYQFKAYNLLLLVVCVCVYMFFVNIFEAQDRRSGVPVHHLKVSSPTVDSTTDCVVPVLEQHGADDGVSLSQDSGVPSSTNADDEHPLQIWTLHGDQEVVDSGMLCLSL